MKILVIGNNAGGMLHFRGALIKELMGAGEVHLAVPSGEFFDELALLGCTLHRVELNRRGVNPTDEYRLYRRYLALMRSLEPDLVLTYTIKPNTYAGLAAKKLGVAYAANITGLGTAFQKRGPLRSVAVALYRKALRDASVVFFQNAGNLGVFLERGIVKSERAVLLNGSGVELDKFAVSEYPTERESFNFVFIGRLMREKGMDELLDAARALRERGVNAMFTLLGYVEENYRGAIAELEEQGLVRYEGYKPDVRPYIAKAHAFVLPSYHEGMANTLLEAGAMGRPLLASDISGCRETIRDGETGMLFTPRDTQALTDALVRFCELPYDARREMGLASHEYIASKFDKKSVNAEVLRALGLNVRADSAPEAQTAVR